MLMLEKLFNEYMTKKYTYVRGERKAEKEIDRFLRSVDHKTSAASVAADLRLLAGEV
jgi:hypothetical protein